MYNIYYELGIAQALGKETVLVKSEGADVLSDFIRTEYVPFNSDFSATFDAYMRELKVQAKHYERWLINLTGTRFWLSTICAAHSILRSTARKSPNGFPRSKRLNPNDRNA